MRVCSHANFSQCGTGSFANVRFLIGKEREQAWGGCIRDRTHVAKCKGSASADRSTLVDECLSKLGNGCRPDSGQRVDNAHLNLGTVTAPTLAKAADEFRRRCPCGRAQVGQRCR